MDIMKMMAIGAFSLVRLGRTWTARHAALGFSQADWELLVQEEYWTPAERRRVRSILADAVNVSLERAGLPSEALPGQYVAAVIVFLVSPSNRLVAAYRAPETYNAVDASGLAGPPELVVMPNWQLVALVLAYSSGVLTDLVTGWGQEFKEQIERQDAVA